MLAEWPSALCVLILFMPLASGAAATDVSFTNVSETAGVAVLHDFGDDLDGRLDMVAGVAAGDVDGNGFVDLVVSRGGPATPPVLLLNQGDGTFSDATSSAGLMGLTGKIAGLALADLDGDEDLDLWLGGAETSPLTIRILANNGDGTFAAPVDGPEIPDGLAMSPAFADWNHDGRLDAYIPQWNEAPSPLMWQGDGLLGFVDVSEIVFSQQARERLLKTFTPNFIDVDGDHRLDLLATNDYGHSQVLLGESDGTFTLVEDDSVLIDEYGMGAAIGDFDNDGAPDWFVSSIFDKERPVGNRLYRNVGSGQFADMTAVAGVSDGGWGWGACFADFDLDGDLDLTHVNGFQRHHTPVDRSRFFLNEGDGTFVESGVAAGFDDWGQGRGVVCFDYDRDGDVDIFVANNRGVAQLYRNDLDVGRHFLMVALRSTTKNTHGVGSRIDLVADDGTQQTRWIQCGANYESQNPSEAHFGMGARPAVRLLRVRWQGSATESRISGFAADERLVVDQSVIFSASFEDGSTQGWAEP